MDPRQDWDPTTSHAPHTELPTRDRSEDRPAVPAARIGRFSILRVLGEGGMGRVYVGYDEELDRKVAIKILRSQAGDARRLVREAQSLARLSHPNVVQVHEAGSDAGSVFVAMELVAGQTLGEWAREQERDWRVRIGLLIQAGRGLEAAHAAGLVHRDFKPDNVLVGDDGRVRVLDFGLVRYSEGLDDELAQTQAEHHSSDARDHDDDDDDDDDDDLTLRGSIMGTPAYMAPEQHAGRACDASADQYAFCVTAYELLFGQLPFGRGRLAQLHEAKRSGTLIAPTDDSLAPRALRALVMRGLAPEPGARWPSMTQLLAQLEALHRPAARARWPLAAGAAALALLGFGLLPRDHPQVCTLDTSALEGAWDAERRAALHESLTASLPPLASPDTRYVDTLTAQASTRLDAWALAWTEARRDSCRATQIEATQSARALDQREVCFARQRAEFSALVSVLTHADIQLPPRLPAVLDTLPDLGACSLAVLQGTPEPLLAPEQRAASEAAYAGLAEARALVRIGRARRARALAETAVTTSEAIDHVALGIEAQAMLAELDTRDGDLDPGSERLRALALRARRAGLLELEAGLRVQLARTLAGDSGRPLLERWMLDEAAELVDSIARPEDPREVTLEVARARLAEQAGDYDASIAARERAHTLAEGRLDATARALLRVGIGTSHYRAGRYEQARAELERCLDAVHAGWGPWAPQAARIEFNLAMICSDLGDTAAARAHMDAALELDLRLWGPESLELARDRFASAYLDFGSGEMSRGCATLEPLLPIYELELGLEHDETAQLITGIGMCRLQAEDDAGALAAYERALAVQLRIVGAEHYEVGLLHSNIAEVYLLRGELERAEQGYERARSIFTAALSADHPLHVYPLRGLGSIWLERGEAGRAVLALERGLELADASNAVELAELRFALARALDQVEGGSAAPSRAAELAEAALATLAGAGGSTRAQVVRAWLAQRASP